MNTLKAVKIFVERITRFMGTLGMICVIPLMLVTTADVLGRGIFNKPIAGTFETSEYMLATIILLGAAYTQQVKGHVAVDFLTIHFNMKTQLICKVLTMSLSLFIVTILVWQGFKLGIEETGVTDQLRIPRAPFKMMVGIGGVFLWLQILFDVIDSVVKLKGEGILNPITVGILGCVLMVALLFLGMPITFVMMFVGFSGIWFLSGLDAALPIVASTLYETAAHYPFTIIPLFVLMGGFADNSGITRRLYDTFDKWFRRLPGGLGIATIVAIAGFSAISGSSVATSAAFAKTVIPEMRRYNYKPGFAGGIVAAGATIDFLIPPSIGFVVYGMLTEQSIGKLLIAGILPGLLLSALFIAIIVAWVKIDPSVAPVPPGIPTWKERIFALWGMWETILVFLITIGGMYLGYVNPTEAGGIGCISLLIITLIKRELTWQQFVGSLYETTRVTCMVMFLVAGASLFSYFLALSTIPAAASTWISELGVSRYMVLTIVVGVYLVLGCFLDAVSMMVLTMPVVFPVIVGLGFDPIWFGVVCVLMMNAGLITPPVGLNVYTIAGIVRDVPMKDVFKAATPFLIAILATTVILTFFPIIATILPAQMGK